MSNAQEPKTVKRGPKVDKESAIIEVDKWLDLKRISKRKGEDSYEQQIKDLVAMVMDGQLTFDFEKKRATYNLISPLTKKESGDVIDTLELRFYVGVQQAQGWLKGIDMSAVDTRGLAIVAGMSGHALALLQNAANDFGEKGLDMSDSHNLRSYAIFFLI